MVQYFADKTVISLKIAEDFVAVEGVDYVVKISDDLRRLKHGNDLIRVSTSTAISRNFNRSKSQRNRYFPFW